jgi:hypothetical protein
MESYARQSRDFCSTGSWPYVGRTVSCANPEEVNTARESQRGYSGFEVICLLNILRCHLYLSHDRCWQGDIPQALGHSLTLGRTPLD